MTAIIVNAKQMEKPAMNAKKLVTKQVAVSKGETWKKTKSVEWRKGQ